MLNACICSSTAELKIRDWSDAIYEPTLWLRYHISESGPHTNQHNAKLTCAKRGLNYVRETSSYSLQFVHFFGRMQRQRVWSSAKIGINERTEKCSVRCVNCQDYQTLWRSRFTETTNAFTFATNGSTHIKTKGWTKKRRRKKRREEHKRAVPTAIVLAIMHSFVRSSQVAQSPHSHYHHETV